MCATNLLTYLLTYLLTCVIEGIDKPCLSTSTEVPPPKQGYLHLGATSDARRGQSSVKNRLVALGNLLKLFKSNRFRQIRRAVPTATFQMLVVALVHS